MGPTELPSQLIEVIRSTRGLLLDFDGPICDVFSGVPAPVIASRLRILALKQAKALPKHVLDEDDPLQVLRRVHEVAPELTNSLETVLRAAEARAVASATPTPHALDVLIGCRATGRRVAIVSNNSASAVEQYLHIQGLADYVELICGRIPSDPGLMKPNPYLLVQALRDLGLRPDLCALAGDSTSDIAAARAAGIWSVGYANKPGKRDQLLGAGANALIGTMKELADALLFANPFSGYS